MAVAKRKAAQGRLEEDEIITAHYQILEMSVALAIEIWRFQYLSNANLHPQVSGKAEGSAFFVVRVT